MTKTNDFPSEEINKPYLLGRRAGIWQKDRSRVRILCAITNMLLQRIPEKRNPLLFKIIRAHSRRCAPCRQDMEAMLVVSAFFESISPLSAPSGLATSVMECIEKILTRDAPAQNGAAKHDPSALPISGPAAEPEPFKRLKKMIPPATAFFALALGVFIGWLIRWLQHHGSLKKTEIGQIAAFAGNE